MSSLAIQQQAVLQGRLTALEQSSGVSQDMYESIFHIEEGAPMHSGPAETYIIPDIINPMPITSVCASASAVFVARRDGASKTSILRLSLPKVQQTQHITVDCAVQCMSLNCDSDRLAVIDSQVRHCCCKLCVWCFCDGKLGFQCTDIAQHQSWLRMHSWHALGTQLAVLEALLELCRTSLRCSHCKNATRMLISHTQARS